MASNQIQQTGSFYLTGSFTASLGFDGTASYARKATRTDGTLSSGNGIESFAYNGGGTTDVAIDTSSAHFNAPINNATGSLVDSASISGTTLTLHLGDGSTLANTITSASYAITASHALNTPEVNIVDTIAVTVLNYAGQDKFTINGLQAPKLTLSRAGTYRFDQSDATNVNHPLAFRLIDDTSYTTGVTQVGIAGTAGAYTEIVVGFDTPVNLRYYCTTHGNIMGNLLNVTDMFALSATGSLQGTATNANTASLATRNVETASAAANVVTFTKGDGSTFDITVGSVVDTGSLLTTASIEGVDITFTKGDASTFDITVDTGSSTADSASFSTRVTDLEDFSSSLDATYVTEAELVAATASLSSSLTTTDQAISASVATLSGSASTARAAIATDYIAADTALSASLTTTDQTISSSVATLSGSASDARNLIAADLDTVSSSFSTRVGDLEDFSSSLDATYATEAELRAITASSVVTASALVNTITFTKGDGSTFAVSIAQSGSVETASRAEGLFNSLGSGKGIENFTFDGTLAGVTVDLDTGSAHFTDAVNTITSSLSASLTTTDQTISSSVAALSASASTSRDAIVASVSGAFASDSSSLAGRVTSLEDFSSSLDATYVTEAELVAATASLSASLTTTDQTISSSVATLSGSASTARNQIATDYIAADTALSASLTTTDQTISSSVATLSGSASTARDTAATQVSGAFASDSASFSTRITDLEDFSSSLDATYVTEAELVAATASLSASLTTTDQTISSSVATLSGSASDSRNAIVANISGAFSIPDGTVSSSAQTIANLQGTDIISGSSQLPSGIVSSSAQTIANLPAGTVSGSAQVTGSTLITGSVQGNTLTFTKGDGSTFDLLVITSSGGGGSTDTGSLLTTASVSETTMSFTKGDNTTFEVYITASVSASYAETASVLLGSVESASFASTASFVTASNVHGPHGTSSVATASYSVSASKVDPISALSDLQHFVDDGAAGLGGIPKGGLYRNGNFVLIRIGDIPFSQTHYLSNWGTNDYVDFGGRLTGFFEDNETWSYGWTAVSSLPTGFSTWVSYGTGDFAHGDVWTDSTTRYVYNVSAGANTTLQGHTTEPALQGFDSWLYTFDGTTRRGYLNGTIVFTSTNTTNMPSSGTGTGNITFGTDNVYTADNPYGAGANSFYISDQVLGSSIGTTAFNNGGDITSDAEYSKVNAFINVRSSDVIDIKGNFTPTIQGTLTFTAVP